MEPAGKAFVIRCQICNEHYNSVSGRTIHCPACRNGRKYPEQDRAGTAYDDEDDEDDEALENGEGPSEDQDGNQRLRKRDSILKVSRFLIPNLKMGYLTVCAGCLLFYIRVSKRRGGQSEIQ